MNEEALKDSYNLFVSEGYNGSMEEFLSLLSSNPEALKDSYSLFQREGYEQPIEDYEALMGVKKKELVSPSGDGSLEQFTSPPDRTFTIDGKDVDKEEFDDYSNEMVTETVQYDPKEDEDQGTEITYRRGDSDFDRSLAYITPDLIDREEEEVVSRMNYLFNDDGFEFKEGGGLTSGFDGMTVRSKNTGNELTINLDPVLGDLAGGETESAQQLKEFLKQNMKEQQEMDALEQSYNTERKKYFSAKSRQDDLESFSLQTEALNDRIKLFLKVQGEHKTALDALMNQPDEIKKTSEWKNAYSQLKAKELELLKEKQLLGQEGEQFESYQKDLLKATGEYYLMKKSDSATNIFETSLTSVKGLVNEFVGGIAEPFAAGVGGVMDVFYTAAQLFDEDFGMSTDEFKERYVDVANYLGVDIPEGATKSEIEFRKWVDSLSNTPANKEEFTAQGWDVDRVQISNAETLVWKNDGGLFGNGGFEEAPEGFLDKNLKDKFQRLVKDQEVKSIKEPTKEFVREMLDFLKFDDVSQELIDSQRENSIIAEGLYGLAKSLPSMLPMLLSRGKAKFKGAKGLPKKVLERLGNYITNKGQMGTTTMMSLLQTDALMQEMENDPNFKYITEREKKKLTLPLALTTAVLESYGLRNIISNKTLLTGLMQNVTRILPKAATANQFTRALKKVIESNVAKGLYSNRGVRIANRVSRAALAEAETGGLQSAAEIGMKNVWNSFEDKALFNTPEMWSEEFGKQVVRGALAEAVGGFVMGIPGAVLSSAAENKLNELSDETFELFEQMRNDETTMKAYRAKLDGQVKSGEKTQEQVDLEYQQFEILSNTANDLMGNDLSVEDRKAALGSIYKINQLEGEMDGLPSKDLGTYQRKKAQVDFLKEQLSNIGRTEAQSQTELSEELQSFERQEGDTDSQTDPTAVTQEEVGIDEQVTEDDQGDIDQFFNKTVETNDVISENLSINKVSKGETAPVTDSKMQVFVLKAAKNAAASIKTLLPNVKMVIHQTQKQFEEATGGRKGKGFFRTNDNSIHINLDKAGRTTVAHEVFHALVMDKIGDKNGGKEIVNAMSSLVSSIRKTLPENSELIESMDRFVENYDSNSKEINEERAAELFGILAGQYKTLSAPSKNKVIQFIKSIAKRFGLNLGKDFTKTDQDVIDLLNTVAQKVRSGEAIVEEDLKVLGETSKDKDLDTDQEQGESGQVGTFNFPEDTQGKEQKAPSVSTDIRSFASLIQDRNFSEFNGQAFVTNMYDFTNSGPTEIAPGITLELDGGKSYVPMMMERQGAKIGDKSNLAAFNTKAQAEGFIRNSTKGNANLFAPHVGTKEGSWQFQQNIFEQLTNAALNNNILSNEELINVFNEGLTSKGENGGVNSFNIFKKNLGKDIKNLDSFISNPQQLIELLDINNNYSPGLRKILNDKLSTNKKYQEVVGVKNKIDFVSKFEDPLNIGSTNGDLVSIVEFDNKTFEISKPKVGAVDYHPSFAYTIKAKIKGIYQPTSFFQSNEATNSYTKYNQEETVVSKKEAIGEEQFKKSNVASSAGSIPKVAITEVIEGKEQRTPLELGLLYKMNKKGFMPPNIPEGPLIKSARAYGLRVERDFIKEGSRRGDFAGYHFSKDGKFFNPRSGTETIQGREQKMADANDLLEAIVQGREEGGFSDSEIKDYLIRNTDFKAAQINKAFKTLSSQAFDSSTFREFPKSFGNIKGGFNAGLNLMSKIDDYYQKLVDKNNRLKDKVEKKSKSKYDELADYGTLTPLTEEEIRENVIEWFTTLPEFTKEGGKGKGRTSQQLTMEKDLLNLMLPDPLRANPERIASINKRIREIKFDEKNLKDIQRQLRTYIRAVLPRTIYSKSETGRLMKLVNDIDASNIESVKNEVMKVVTEKTNQSLQTTIFNILNRKNQTIQTGRLKGVRIDNSTRKRLTKINGMILSPKATAEQINKQIESLLEEYNKAAKIAQDVDGNQQVKIKDDLTQEEIDLMAEITLAMQINNSFTQEMNDPNKTTLLSNVLNSLNQMEATGKALFEYQLIEDAAVYRENSRKAFKEITGIDLDPLASLLEQGFEKKEITTAMLNREYKRLKDDVSLDQERVTPAKKTKILGRAKDSLLKILNNVDTFVLGRASDLTTLIEQISTQPGEIFQGAIQKQADLIREGNRLFKDRMMSQQLEISDKMTKLFGPRWTKVNRKNSNETESIVYSEKKQRVLEAELNAIENNKNLSSSERTKALQSVNENINANTMPISQNQLLYYYSQMQDPSLAKSFANTFDPTGNYDNEFESRIREEIESKLDPKLKDFSNWLVQDYYPSVYNQYNETYKKIYRTDMPWNQFYAGRLYREGVDEADSLDLLADSASWITNVAAASSKARQQNSNPIKKIDGIDALITYTRDMEYFAALAVPIRNINKVFTDPLIKNTIENEFGGPLLKLINESIQKIANKGIREQQSVGIINLMNNSFLLSRLGFNPTLILKQMTSFVTYANDIGYTTWLLNAPTPAKGVATYREIMANSVVLKDRYNQPITQAIETYAEKKFTEMNGGVLNSIGITKERQNNYTRWLMSTTMLGDKAAIIFGGVPNYLYYKKQFKAKNENSTEQQAIDYAIKRFESDTLRTQQSSDLQDKDYYQTSNAFARAFNMFLTTPKQYFRREIIAMRNMSRIIASGGKKGKGSFGQNLRTFATYHVVMPVFFQWIAQGLPGLLRDAEDEDLDDLGMAAILGNINALFIIGDLAVMAKDYITGKPWAGEAPSIPVFSQPARLIKLLQKADKVKDPKKKNEYMMEFYSELVSITSLPLPTIQKFVNNYGDLLSGNSKDMGQFLLKLFNFSEYAQGVRKNKKTTTKKKTRKKTKQVSSIKYLQQQKRQRRNKRPY